MDTSELAKKLLSVCSSKEVQLSVISEEVMRLFLLIGSETPDNLNCYSHIEYGVLANEENTNPNKSTYGLKIRGKDISIADIMNVVEDIELPTEVAAVFPTLTQKELDAATRIITMILLAVECTQSDNQTNVTTPS